MNDPALIGSPARRYSTPTTNTEPPALTLPAHPRTVPDRAPGGTAVQVHVDLDCDRHPATARSMACSVFNLVPDSSRHITLNQGEGRG